MLVIRMPPFDPLSAAIRPGRVTPRRARSAATAAKSSCDRRFQLHLAGLGWSWSHINHVSCALRFFVGVTLGRSEAFDRIISAKEPKKLPVVLSGEEIVTAVAPHLSASRLLRNC